MGTPAVEANGGDMMTLELYLLSIITGCVVSLVIIEIAKAADKLK